MTSIPLILYVDDEPMNLKVFEMSFRRKFRILTANSSMEALEILASNRDVSAVISDMRMPEMTGLHFISIAKEHFFDINYYILTGYAVTPEISDAINSKLIKQYFRKPLNVGEIEREILKR